MADAFQRCRDVEEFEKMNRIGEGTYGVVYRAKDRKSREVVALKRMRMEKDDTGLPISSLREISILQELRHKNIVTLRSVVVGKEDLDSIFLVMEYCEQDLATLLDSMKTPFTVSEVKCLMTQLLEGVRYCHEKFIIHRDLKLSNLLLNGKGILKIADFGLARPYGTPFRPMTPKVVTLWYRAPELLLGASVYTTAIDLWSAGCIFGELLKHSPLLPGKQEMDQLEQINNLLGTPNENIWPGFNQLRLARTIQFPRQPFNNLKLTFPKVTAPTIDLLNRFLTYHPTKRITAKDALEHPYFSERPMAKDPEMMPTFPEIRNEEYENSRRKRQQVEEKKAISKDEMFSRDFSFSSYDPNLNFNPLFPPSEKKRKYN